MLLPSKMVSARLEREDWLLFDVPLNVSRRTVTNGTSNRKINRPLCVWKRSVASTCILVPSCARNFDIPLQIRQAL